MKHKILTALFVAFVAVTNAQQLQTSSMYDMQGILHNPAMAGMQQPRSDRTPRGKRVWESQCRRPPHVGAASGHPDD